MAENNPSNKEILEMQHNLEEIQDIISGFVKSYEKMDLDPFKLTSAYTEWASALANNPQKIINDGLEFWQNSIQLTQQAMSSLFSGTFESVIEPHASDRRFRHEDWSEKPIFAAIQQSYLLTSQWLRNLVTDVEGLDKHTAEKVKFFTERYLDAMSPTNFALTNPAVVEKTVETNGANLVNGLKNMLADLEEGDGQLRISMTDTEAFELGKNVAVTPGKVVFQNRMFQLLQYSPSTDKVLKQPLLIVPPWINKYYIL
ncbi:MAG: class I poly(R)-hydroxyalkanoic acid synthase, partial [Gammaproteobacteria bacterium]|nr:class I poly(R)-hydroxyalkanoic acid synthase [Gammaproteobacteria bacterium]